MSGVTSSPTPFLGGVLVPVPVLSVWPVVAGPLGAATLAGLPGGGGPLSIYVQAVCVDPAQPAGFALTNALRLDLLP